MAVENDILEIQQLIADAKDCLRKASDLAVEASGYEPGNDVTPDREGDPVLLALADRLTVALNVSIMAVTPEAEALFKDTQEYADDVQDRKDGQSY